MTAVGFYFDVMCPWAYQASLWIREVRQQRELAVHWRAFSLEESKWHEGTKHPWERDWSWGWSLLRVSAYLGEVDGQDAVDRFYACVGRGIHVAGEPVHTPDGAKAVLRQTGWDPSVVDAAIADDTTHTAVLDEHRRAVERGVHGVPTLVIDDTDVLFGPVLASAPTGAAAVRLWDSLLAWREFPQLYEVRRPRLPADDAHIRSIFAPYLQATGDLSTRVRADDVHR